MTNVGDNGQITLNPPKLLNLVVIPPQHCSDAAPLQQTFLVPLISVLGSWVPHGMCLCRETLSFIKLGDLPQFPIPCDPGEGVSGQNKLVEREGPNIYTESH